MKYDVLPDPTYPDHWRVEAINEQGDGECYVAVFSGPRCEERAKEYARWMTWGERFKRW